MEYEKAPMTEKEFINKQQLELQKLREELEWTQKVLKEQKEMYEKYKVSFEMLVKTINK